MEALRRSERNGAAPVCSTVEVLATETVLAAQRFDVRGSRNVGKVTKVSTKRIKMMMMIPKPMVKEEEEEESDERDGDEDEEEELPQRPPKKKE
ncbi:hypothetical protein MUK42_32561 [Musa troglodytarum]|uniref:Uncharacterized protein n=1 Tax=Musa troglodytarum TaxID=320322 RepID=A0A9E7FDH6_9LILI|nr:hypothetical protein MUK42_32561 [Musa troglodytarum]